MNLLVVLGAGASYDCATPGGNQVDEYRPPLVTLLFPARGRFATILAAYPFAQAAAADIRRKAEDGTFKVEEYLRALRRSDSVDARQRFLEIPLYLQNLLLTVSRAPKVGIPVRGGSPGYTDDPDNYHSLVNAALDRAELTVFVTLNYDTILDRVLFQRAPLDDMLSYVDADPRWILVKPHGSVNWGRALSGVTAASDEEAKAELDRVVLSAREPDVEPDIELRLRDVELRSRGALTDVRRGPEGRVFYPALAVPLGSEDEIVCPDLHRDRLIKFLADEDGLDLLVVGYSGLDSEVLRLLTESGNQLRSLAVVSGSERDAEQAAELITNAIPLGAAPALHPNGFTAWTHSPDFDRYFDSLA